MSGIMCDEDVETTSSSSEKWWESFDYMKMHVAMYRWSYIHKEYVRSDERAALKVLIAAVLREHRPGKPFSPNVRMALEHAGAILRLPVK